MQNYTEYPSLKKKDKGRFDKVLYTAQSSVICYTSLLVTSLIVSYIAT